MARFCRNCGNPLGENARFCTKCGTQVVSTQNSQPVQAQMQQPKMQCRQCGNPLNEGAKFCRKCGAKIINQESIQPASKEAPYIQGTNVQHNQQQSVQPSSSQKEQIPYEQTAEVNYTQPQQNNIQTEAAQYVRQAQQQFTRTGQGMIQPTFSEASDRAGETALQLPQVQSALSFAEEAKAVLNPFTEFFTGVSGFFKGIINIIKYPKALTFSVVLTWIWILLIALKQFRIGGIFTDALSWITFAQGGLGNGLRGIVGGLFGKVVVASGLYALLDGGIDIGKGIKQWFNCFNASSNTGAILTGAGLSLILYNFFVANANLGTTMVAITGMILSLQALGSQNGFIFRMARSLMSKKLGNHRVSNDVRANAFISGIGMGSVLAIPLSVLPFGFIPYIIGVFLFIIGIIISFAIRGKEVPAV